MLRAGLEKLAVGLDMYPGSSVVKVGVASMGVRSPEGNLVRTGARLQSSKSGEPPASASPASCARPLSICHRSEDVKRMFRGCEEDNHEYIFLLRRSYVHLSPTSVLCQFYRGYNVLP